MAASGVVHRCDPISDSERRLDAALFGKGDILKEKAVPEQPCVQDVPEHTILSNAQTFQDELVYGV